MRLIDADALMKRLKEDPLYPLVKRCNIEGFINAEPTVDAVPVRHGKWIDLKPQGDSRFMCTVCKWKEKVPTCMGEPTIWRFCPSCGARMDGKDGDHHD